MFDNQFKFLPTFNIIIIVFLTSNTTLPIQFLHSQGVFHNITNIWNVQRSVEIIYNRFANFSCGLKLEDFIIQIFFLLNGMNANYRGLHFNLF